MSGGQPAIRGYLIQTLIGLLEALDPKSMWTRVTLEPNVDSEKVDILWEYSDGTTLAVQVKSSQNPFRKSDIQRWAEDLQTWKKADKYELILVGTPSSGTVAKIRTVGGVAVPACRNLDLRAFKEQAAHRLEQFLKRLNIPPGDGTHREMLAGSLAENLATLATTGESLTRAELVDLLRRWVPRSDTTLPPNVVQLIRVFVSSPEDVAEERAVLDEVVRRINRSDGHARRVRLELWKWEDEAVPQIGAEPQKVVDNQTPVYDIYLGIMAHRFGTPIAESSWDEATMCSSGTARFRNTLLLEESPHAPMRSKKALLWGSPPKMYLPEWREVMLLLAGTLYQHGPAKVDNLARTMLNRLGSMAELADEARCAGLLGMMITDLAPVGYESSDGQYKDLLGRVMAIFDREQSAGVPVETRISAADALGQAGDPRLDPRREDYWVTIPAGEFMMGAQSADPKKLNFDEEAYEDESSVHQVYVDEFRIARYPVTLGQYYRFVEDEGYEQQRWWSAGGFGDFSKPEDWENQRQYPSRPVVGVSWYEAAAYCAWAGCRLLTEAEWDRAARGVEGRKYPWGKEQPDETRVNFDGNIGHPTPVGIFPPDATPEGICDMGGNVVEWCQDGYGEYPAKSVRNPAGPKQATCRVFRGGCWYDDAGSCRSADRGRYEPGDRDSYLGFRVAAVPPGK